LCLGGKISLDEKEARMEADVEVKMKRRINQVNPNLREKNEADNQVLSSSFFCSPLFNVFMLFGTTVQR
jgi:predicted DsbA family dithiol-disulfide isomerase